MNDSDALERVLADLATRADPHQPPDRVLAIHRRARRAAAARIAVGAGVLTALVAVVAVAAGSGGLPLTGGNGVRPADRTHGPTGSARPSPTAPFLTVTLRRDDTVGALISPKQEGVPVVVQVTVHGLVPQGSPTAGQAVPTGTESLLGLRMDWGDRSVDGAAPQYACAASVPLVPIDTQFLMTHQYQRPGTYTATFRTGGCSPVGGVTQTLSLTVP